MRARHLRLVFLAIILIISFQSAAQAEIYKVWFNVWTTNFPDTTQRRLHVEFMIADTTYRAPEAITKLEVKAPNAAGTILHLEGSWYEMYEEFFTSFLPTAFPEGVIPSGVYTATIVDKSSPAKTIKVSKTLTVGWLNCPTITGITPGTLTPTITWTKVAGAQNYRIDMNNLTRQEPVYFYPYHKLDVYPPVGTSPTVSFTIPNHVLKPGEQYQVRIRARDSDKMLNKLSTSNWVNFTTP